MSVGDAPRSIGGYVLHRPIGGGGMGQVWLASRAGIAAVRKLNALKLVASISASEQVRRRFLDEASVSLLLSHSNIVQVFDVGIEGDLGYIAMEWVEGIDLASAHAARRAQGRPWPVAMIGFILGEILRGLEYAHSLAHEGRPLSIVHRDISPQNVLLSLNGEVKIADFGIARSTLAKATDLEHAGKWKYMAPEQARRQQVGPAADLYAVGVILHELLTGEPMRSAPSHALDPDVPSLPNDIPHALVDLHRRLLAAEPAQRMRSARDALTVVEEWEGYRRASHALGMIVRDVRPDPSHDVAHRTEDLDATESATRTGTATAPTRTSPVASRPRRRVLIVTLATATVIAAWGGVGVAIYRATHPLLWRGGCPVDAEGDGDLDVVGFLARSREPEASLEMVVLDGSDGSEIHHARRRGDIRSAICESSIAMIVLTRNGPPESWGTGDWGDREEASAETDFQLRTLAEGLGSSASPPLVELLLNRRSLEPWPGVGRTSNVVVEDDRRIKPREIWRAMRGSDGTLLIEAMGAQSWKQRFPLGTTPPTLAHGKGVVLTVSTSPRPEGEHATLMMLDAATGELRDETPLGIVQLSSFFVLDGDLLLTDVGDRLVVFRIPTLERVWEFSGVGSD